MSEVEMPNEDGHLSDFYLQANSWIKTFQKGDGNLLAVKVDLAPTRDAKLRQVDVNLMEAITQFKLFLKQFDITITSRGAVKNVKDDMESIRAKIMNAQKQLGVLQELPKEIVDSRFYFIQWLKNEVIGKSYSKSVQFNDDFTPQDFAVWSSESATLNEKLFGTKHV